MAVPCGQGVRVGRSRAGHGNGEEWMGSGQTLAVELTGLAGLWEAENLRGLKSSWGGGVQLILWCVRESC